MKASVKFPRAHPTLFAVGILFEVLFSLESEERQRQIVEGIRASVARYRAGGIRIEPDSSAKGSRVLRRMCRALTWVERLGEGLGVAAKPD